MSDTELTAKAPAPEAPDDIRSSLNAAFEQAADPSPASKPDASVRRPASAESQPDSAPPAHEDAAERPRGPDGKFVKAEAAEAPEPVQEAAEPALEATKPAAPEPDAEFAKATAKWSPQAREMLTKLPAEAQAFLVERHRAMEGDYSRKMNEVTALRRDYEPIDQLFRPYEGDLQARGLTKAGLIQAWYNVEKGLMAGGDTAAQMAAAIIQNYKIPLAAMTRALGMQSQVPADPVDPQPENGQPVRLPPEIVQKLSEQEQVLRALQQDAQQRRQYEFNSAASRVMSDIERFKSETDSSGALLHPHFDEVEQMMAHYTNVARASGQPVPPLSELYDTAVWANPSTRAQLQQAQAAAAQAQRAAEEKKRADEARAKAEKARRAGSSVTGAPGSGQNGRVPDGSLRGELEAQFARATAAA